MIRLVNSILSREKITTKDIECIKNLISKYLINPADINEFKYDDRKFYEVDFDLLDFKFTKEKIYEEINYLIELYEEIIKYFNKNECWSWNSKIWEWL